MMQTDERGVDPLPGEPQTPTMIEVADLSPEAMYELFEAHGWGDGLPLVPPTPERVDAMLAEGTGDPDEVIATLQPRFGAATRRVVAINAVLAGCPPVVFPVVVSAVRALASPQVNLRGVNATTHPSAPLVIVHGEIVKRAGFNAGVGAFGPGNRANATVGRAIRLIMLHVAGPGPASVMPPVRASRRNTPTASPRTPTSPRGRATPSAATLMRRVR
jgi:hypothetical protein